MAIRVSNVNIGSGKPKICVPIVAEDVESILTIASLVKESDCDLVEWRADWYKDVLDIDATVAVLERLKGILDITPIIFTIRTAGEGGQLDISYEQYRDILLEVAYTRLADIVDVEVYMDNRTSELIENIQATGTYVIGSNHNFEETEDEELLCKKILEISESGADIPKLAVMPNSRDDVVRLLTVTYKMSEQLDKPIVTVSMGQLGALSRISGEIFGSAMTFGSLKKASAPGQLAVKELKNILHLI